MVALLNAYHNFARTSYPRSTAVLQHALGLMLSTGEAAGAGFPQDEERARELFKTAAIGTQTTRMPTTLA